MIETKMEYKGTLKFLKNQLNTVSKTRIIPKKVSIDIRSENPIKVEAGRNFRLTNTLNGFAVSPTAKRLSNGMSTIAAYKVFEYGTSELSRDPISPALRKHVKRVIIPSIIKQMENKIG